MTTTRLGEAVDALVALLETETGLQVLDGPTLDVVMDEAIVVGLETDGPGYSTDVSIEDGLGRPRMREDFTVGCMLTLVSGDAAVGPLRTRASTILGQIDDALRDVHRTSVWEEASVSGGTKWAPLQTPDGVSVVVFFAVRGSCLL